MYIPANDTAKLKKESSGKDAGQSRASEGGWGLAKGRCDQTGSRKVWKGSRVPRFGDVAKLLSVGEKDLIYRCLTALTCPLKCRRCPGFLGSRAGIGIAAG